MEYTRLGSTGLKVSRICLGCHDLRLAEVAAVGAGRRASRPFIRRALELGINFFDTADMYSDGVSEEIARPCPARTSPRATRS